MTTAMWIGTLIAIVVGPPLGRKFLALIGFPGD